MEVLQHDLNTWRLFCGGILTLLQSSQHFMRQGEVAEAEALVEIACTLVAGLKRRMERAGAEEMSCLVDTPPELLDTPANRRYAATLREAWEALKEVERERGIHGGTSAILKDILEEAEREVYGPDGRGEGAGE